MCQYRFSSRYGFMVAKSAAESCKSGIVVFGEYQLNAVFVGIKDADLGWKIKACTISVADLF